MLRLFLWYLRRVGRGLGLVVFWVGHFSCEGMLLGEAFALAGGLMVVAGTNSSR
jgi:hypothetical protein